MTDALLALLPFGPLTVWRELPGGDRLSLTLAPGRPAVLELDTCHWTEVAEHLASYTDDRPERAAGMFAAGDLRFLRPNCR